MKRFAGTSLKTRLYLMVLVAFIPVTVLIFFIAEDQKSLETASILNKTVVMARVAANVERQQLESAHNLLTTIANAYPMAEGRMDKLASFLTRLSKHSTGYAGFGIADPEGQLLAGSDPDWSGIDYSGKSWFMDCLQRKKWTIGPYQGEHINEDAVLYFATPVLDRTQTLVAVAFAALNLDWTNRTVFKLLAELPVGSRLTLLDEYHGMLRYTADTDRWSVPDSYDPALRKRIVGHGSGTITSTDEAGVMRIHAFAPVSGSFRNRQVTMVLEIPQKIAFSASSRVFLRNLAMLFASALIAVVSIWWTADVFILRRVRAMVAVTRKLADGELDARIGRIGGSDELSHLAGVFDEMAASLQKRIEHETQVMASLEQSREQLRKLAAYQQEVREEERLRIAREIHDEFGQCLTILKMDLAWLNKQLSPKLGEIVEKMQSMSQVIEEALKNLHAVTAELRPVILDDFGLAAAIEWQIDEFRKRSGINCNLESNGFEPDLPKDQATALFRIFQETLTNILRHAQADDVEVRLEEHEGVLVLDVHDNGRGITTDEINHPMSYGLLGMRERLYPWNGRVTFQGRPGRGTRVTIELPLPGKGAQV